MDRFICTKFIVKFWVQGKLISLFQAQLIAQSIGRAFQVSYMEFLKANGIENTGHIREMDYQEVLNQQEIFGEELYLFSNKDMQKEVNKITVLLRFS